MRQMATKYERLRAAIKIMPLYIYGSESIKFAPESRSRMIDKNIYGRDVIYAIK